MLYSFIGDEKECELKAKNGVSSKKTMRILYDIWKDVRIFVFSCKEKKC